MKFGLDPKYSYSVFGNLTNIVLFVNELKLMSIKMIIQLQKLDHDTFLIGPQGVSEFALPQKKKKNVGKSHRLLEQHI